MRNFLENESSLKRELKTLLRSNALFEEKSSDFDLDAFSNFKRINFRTAAVLIPIIFDPEGPAIVFTKRAKTLREHPGQIAFPGGKIEKDDSSEIETVIRECFEEIYLSSEDLNILGKLPEHNTITGYSISPFVGIIKNYQNLKPELSEVSEIFKVPLKFLLNKKNMSFQSCKYKDHERAYYSIPYGPYYIWGATARIIKTFSDMVEKKNENV